MAQQQLGKAASRNTDLMTRADVVALLASAASFPISGPPVPKSSAYTIGSTAGDLGKLFDLTGSFALTLPAASGGTATAPLYYHFRKRDGSGRCTVVPNGSDTIEGVNAPIALYQERATLVSFGSGWIFPPGGRERTAYIVPPGTAASASSTVYLYSGFDADAAEVEVAIDGFSNSASAYVLIRVALSGTFANSGYSYEGSDNGAIIFSNNDIAVPVTLQANTYSAGSWTTTVRNPNSTAAKGASIENRGSLYGGAKTTSTAVSIRGWSGTAGPVTALAIVPQTGTITFTYSARIIRA